MTRACLILGLALALPFGGARGDDDPRAVERTNGEVGLRYIYGSIEEGRSSFAPFEIVFLESSSHEAGLSARLTVPLGDHLGARLSAFGSLPFVDSDGGESDLATFVDGRAEVFWRDPSLGYVDFGYEYTWFDLPFGGQAASHGATVGAGVFFPDLGVGELDWIAAFEYARQRLTGPGISGTSFDVYRVAVGPRWYMTETFLAAPAFAWSRTELSGDRVGSRLSGSLALDWLIGATSGRYVSIGVFGSFGRLETNLPSPFPDVERDFYSVGGRLSVYVAPVRSFAHLLRTLQ